MQSSLYTPIPCVTHYCFNVSLLVNRLIIIVSKQLWIKSLNLSVVQSSFHDPLTLEVKGLSLIHFNNYESGFYQSNLQGKPTCSHTLPSQLLLLVKLIAMCPETNSKCSMLSPIFASPYSSQTINMYWSVMVYSGWKFILFLVFGRMTSNFICLTFSTLSSSSLWRIVTIFLLFEKQYSAR